MAATAFVRARIDEKLNNWGQSKLKSALLV